MHKLIYFILICYLGCLAQKDTTILSNGSQTKFIINEKRIDSSSIIIKSSQDLKIPNWKYEKNDNSIIFESPVDSGNAFTIVYDNNYINFPKKIYIYKKHYLDSNDLIVNSKSMLKYENRYSEQLQLSGYKSLGLSVDNNGSINFEQGLDIHLKGEIRPGTVVSAHLNDQGSSLEGSTKEISDFDLIYIELKNSNLNIIAGDQYVNWMYDGILNKQKKIKGISSSVNNKNLNFKIFGSLTGGKFNTQNIFCKNGVQGPYYLKVNGENEFISIVSGTLRLKINGDELKEDEDYTVDYDLGILTFKNNRLMRESDIVRAEYEYKTFNYQQILAGINTRYSTTDSSFKVRGSWWTESENRNNPIDLTLTNKEKTILQNCGDSLPLISSEILIDTKDVPSKSSIYPLYKKSRHNGGNEIFVYTQYNPATPADCNGYYQVWFIDMGKSKGNYSKDSVYNSNYMFYIYEYVGENKGDYSPMRSLPSPERKITGEIIAELIKKNILIKAQIAGENLDKNTFSSKDDHDNNNLAFKNSFLFGNKDKEKTLFYLSGEYLYSSRNFTKELMTNYEKRIYWDDTITSREKIEEHYYDLALGISPSSWFNSEFTYGQNRDEIRLNTEKIKNETNFIFSKLYLKYTGSFFRHANMTFSNSSQRQSLKSSYEISNNNKTEFFLNEEWKKDSTSQKTGLLEAKITYLYTPIQLNESISMISYRKGKEFFSSRDTARNYRWEQSINCKPLPVWIFKGKSLYDRNIIDNKTKETTLLIEVENNISSHNFSLLQHYSTSFENASSFIQVPIYAGKGLGTFMYDTILKQYVKRIPGDWFIEQREVFDQTSNQRMKKTNISINWSFEPVKMHKGILSDLRWEGNLFFVEHVNAEESSFSSWFPGYYTIRNYTKSNKKFNKVRFADLSYRQDVYWNPKLQKEISASLYATPSLKKYLGYYESAIEIGLEAAKKGEKFKFINTTKYLAVNHEENDVSNMKFKDVNSEFVEKYQIFKSTDIFVKECLGTENQTNDIKKNLSLFQGDSLIYYQFSTGFQWQPKFGLAEISYTYSNVPFKENLDYRIANGFQAGISHVFTAFVNIKANKYLQINSFYRAEINNKRIYDKNFNQTLSLEAKVLF